MLEYQLFFGRTRVSDADWADFAAQTITVNLPDGFTVIDGDGQWMNPTTRHISHERSTTVIAAVPDTPASAAAISAVKQAYLARFHHQSVGTVVYPVCAAF